MDSKEKAEDLNRGIGCNSTISEHFKYYYHESLEYHYEA